MSAHILIQTRRGRTRHPVAVILKRTASTARLPTPKLASAIGCARDWRRPRQKNQRSIDSAELRALSADT
jgi:hypothetical protein